MKRLSRSDIERGLSGAAVAARNVSNGAAGFASRASGAMVRSASTARDELLLVREAFREVSAEHPDLAGAARLQALKLGIGVAGLVSLVMTPARGASRLASLRKLRGAAVPLSLQVASSDIPQFVAMVRRRAQAKKDAVTST